MVPISSTVTTIFALVTGGYLSWYFHEYVHWIVGKLFSGSPNVLYASWYEIPYPYAVEYNSLEQMPDWGIRLAGVLPHALWTFVGISYIGNPISILDIDIFLMINTISEVLTSIPFWRLVFISASVSAGISVSPSDLVATLYPNRYRDNTGNELSHSEWVDILFSN